MKITLFVIAGILIGCSKCQNIQEEKKTVHHLQKTETIKKNPETPGQLDCTFEEELEFEGLSEGFGPV